MRAVIFCRSAKLWLSLHNLLRRESSLSSLICTTPVNLNPLTMICLPSSSTIGSFNGSGAILGIRVFFLFYFFRNFGLDALHLRYLVRHRERLLSLKKKQSLVSFFLFHSSLPYRCATYNSCSTPLGKLNPPLTT